MIRRLAQAEYDFGNAMPQRAVMVDIGESQVFERQVPHPMQRRIYIRRTTAHLFEQSPELVFQHLRSTLCEVQH